MQLTYNTLVHELNGSGRKTGVWVQRHTQIIRQSRRKVLKYRDEDGTLTIKVLGVVINLGTLSPSV